MTRTEEVTTKARTMIAQIPALTRMSCGWRDASFVAGVADDDFDVRVTGTVLKGRSHFIQITLELNDTYTVRRLRIPTRRAKDQTIRVEETASYVHCDKLGNVVYHMVNK